MTGSAQATQLTVVEEKLPRLVRAIRCLAGRGEGDAATGAGNGAEAETLTRLRRLRWAFLAFVPSSLVLGVTTYVTTDVAAVPLLWVVPLALYLLTFVIAFSRPLTVESLAAVPGYFAIGPLVGQPQPARAF